MPPATRRNTNSRLIDPITFKYSGRLIVSVGYSRKDLMYKSTGQNSSHPETWFSCRGISSSSKKSKTSGMTKKGWIIKPSDGNIWKLLGFSSDVLPYDLKSRFSSSRSAIISAKIGGGFWETEQGRKAFDFFRNLPEYEEDHSEELRRINIAVQKAESLENLTVSEAIAVLF